MVNYSIFNFIFKIIDSATPGSRGINAVWLSEAITFNVHGANQGATVKIDFAYDISSIIEYTLDNGLTWIQLNDGAAISGGQSISLRVQDGDQLNLRAKTAGNLTRCIVGES